MSSNDYYSRTRSLRDIHPPIYVSRYMALMVRAQNFTWPDSSRLANIFVNMDDFHSYTVTENVNEYMSAAAGWEKLWRHLDNRGAGFSPTEETVTFRGSGAMKNPIKGLVWLRSWSLHHPSIRRFPHLCKTLQRWRP